MWVECENGDYVNLDAVTLIRVEDVGSGWEARVNDSPSLVLKGILGATQAEAQDAVRRLVHGIDPSTVI